MRENDGERILIVLSELDDFLEYKRLIELSPSSIVYLLVVWKEIKKRLDKIESLITTNTLRIGQDIVFKDESIGVYVSGLLSPRADIIEGPHRSDWRNRQIVFKTLQELLEVK